MTLLAPPEPDSSTPPARGWRVAVVVVTSVVALVAGVGLGLSVVTGALASPISTSPAAATTTGNATAAATGPALDLHGVDWADAALPGSVCRSPGPIRLSGGEALSVPSSFDGPSPNYPQDVHVDVAAIVYGDLTGDGHDEAAVPLGCANHDSTLVGTTVDTVLLFDGGSGQAVLLGHLESSQPRLGEIPNDVKVASLRPGAVVGSESFYTPEDATCCPSGKASTVWPWTPQGFAAPRATVVGTGAAQNVDAEALAAAAARSAPGIDPSAVGQVSCASKYLDSNGVVVGCDVHGPGPGLTAVVVVQLVDLASRNTRTYVMVPHSGCPDIPPWAAKIAGDRSDNPCGS